MKLLTVGDSFTYGEELKDRNLAWPSLLANKLNYELINKARPGSGNTRIVRNVIEYPEPVDITIISWSHFARIAVSDEIGTFDIWPGGSPSPHQHCAPWRKEIIEYNNRHHNDSYLYRQHLINIVLLQNWFKSHGRKYIMVDAFGNNKQYDKEKTKRENLILQIDTKYYIDWPNETMMEWTYDTPQGPNGHFLEQGHEIVANKIYEYIRHLSWVS